MAVGVGPDGANEKEDVDADDGEPPFSTVVEKERPWLFCCVLLLWPPRLRRCSKSANRPPPLANDAFFLPDEWENSFGELFEEVNAIERESGRRPPLPPTKWAGQPEGVLSWENGEMVTPDGGGETKKCWRRAAAAEEEAVDEVEEMEVAVLVVVYEPLVVAVDDAADIWINTLLLKVTFIDFNALFTNISL